MLLHVYASGFMAFPENKPLDLDCSVSQFDYIVGRNGAGKSSFFDAVFFAYFGAQSARIRNDLTSIVHKGDRTATVKVTFSNNGTLYKIIRTYTLNKQGTSGTHKLSVFTADDMDGEWTAVTDGMSVKQGEDVISSILGVDYDTFFSLAAIKQNSITGGTVFTQANSDQRRAILISLFPRLKEWDIYHQIFVDKKTELNQAHTRCTASCDALRSQLDIAQDRVLQAEDAILDIQEQIQTVEAQEDEGSQDSIDDLNRQLATARTKLETTQDEITITRDSLYQAQELVDGTLAKVEMAKKYTATCKALKKLRTGIASDREEADCLSTRITRVENEAKTLDTRHRDATTRILALNDKLNDLKNIRKSYQVAIRNGSGSCPTCGSDVTLDHIQDMKAKCEADIQAARDDYDCLSDQIRSLATQLDDANYSKENLEHQLGNLTRSIHQNTGSLEANQSLIRDMENDLGGETYGTLTALLNDRQESVNALSNKLYTLMDRVSALKNSIRGLEERIENVLNQTSQKDAELQKLHTNLSFSTGQADAAKQQAGTIEQSMKTTQAQLATITDELDVVSLLVDACSEKGIPSHQLGSIITTIEEAQNEFLENIMGDNVFTLHIDQAVALKSGAIRPAMTLTVSTPSGDRPLESFSGGEKVRLTLANLAGLLTAVNMYSNTHIDTLYLDEPFGALDSDAALLVPKLLEELIAQGIVKQIFLVTHNSEMIMHSNSAIMFKDGATTRFAEWDGTRF